MIAEVVISRHRFLIVVATALMVVACAGGEGSSNTTPTTARPTADATSAATPLTTTEGPSGTKAGPPAVAGVWLTDLGVTQLQLRLEMDGESLVGVLDSLGEGVLDIPVAVSVDGAAVTIDVAGATASFSGVISGDQLRGTWTQAGTETAMVFERLDQPLTFSRPQVPQPPFPYLATDETFSNGAFTLAGTLTMPEGEGPFPIVVLVTGSGSQDRDETILGHKPFLVLADALARQGVASFRYDDRGVGESGGDPEGATTEDLAADALAAVAFLSDRPDVGPIGVMGHSEGGLIAPIVATQLDDVEFIVLLAGPGRPGLDVLLRQTEDLLRGEGVPETVIAWRMGWNDDVLAVAASDVDADVAAGEIRAVLEEAAATAPPGGEVMVTAEAVDEFVTALTDPWMRWFLAYDPAPVLAEVEVPVLALIGELDLQVSAELNIPALKAALAENPDATVSELPSLNHLFQTATTGAISEYGQIEETFAPDAIDIVVDWILARF